MGKLTLKEQMVKYPSLKVKKKPVVEMTKLSVAETLKANREMKKGGGRFETDTRIGQSMVRAKNAI